MKVLSSIFFGLLLIFTACELDPDFAPGGSSGTLKAKFSVSKQTDPVCYAPCTVTFTNTSTGATQFTWVFGDGGTSSTADPSHEYDLGGEYMAILTAKDGGGNESKDTVMITIETPITFQKTFGDANAQVATAVVPTDDGGYAIVGYETISNVNAGYFLRLDANGNAVVGFPKKYGEGAQYDYRFNALQQTDDGGFIITGKSDNLLLLLRTDALGNVVGSFPKEYNDAGEVFPDVDGTAVVQMPDGGFGMLGTSYNYRGGSGQTDFVYFRTTPSGDQVDFAYFAADPLWSDDRAYAWLFNGTDEFLAVGSSQPNGVFSDEFFAIRFDLDGDVINTPSVFGGSEQDVLTGICLDPKGGYAATGSTKSSGAGNSDIYFVKLNANGDVNVSSQKTFGGVSIDDGATIQSTSDDGFFIVGNTFSFGLGGQEIYVIRLDNNGNEVFTKTIGGFELDYAMDFVVTSDRGLLIVGGTESYGAGQLDLFIIKTDAKGRVF